MQPAVIEPWIGRSTCQRSHYLSTGLTKGFRSVKDAPKRAEASKELASRAAGGVCLIPTSRYSCAFHLAANVSHSAMYFWFGIGPGVMALSLSLIHI